MGVVRRAKYSLLITLTMCLAVAVSSLFFAPAAFAYSKAIEVELPVTIVVDGDIPSDPETFEVVLEALDEGAPMPAGAEGSSCSIQVLGGTKASFGAISYEKPCVWTYQVTQKPGTNAMGVYDSAFYTVSVSITNDENGELAQTVAVHPDGLEQKTADIVFSNYYDEPLPNTGDDDPLPQTGDDVPVLIIGSIVIVAIVFVAVALIAQRRQRHNER